MDYSAKELLLRPGETKPTPFWTRIIQVAFAMLIITICVTLLVAPTVFVTIFILESFRSDSSVPSIVHQHPPSVFLRKLITQSNQDMAVKSHISSLHNNIITNVPDYSNSKTVRLSTDLKKTYEDVDPRSKRSTSNALDQMSTKDIQRLLQILDAIEHHKQTLDSITEEDKTRLNRLMDTFGIGHIREQRSVAMENKVSSEDNLDKNYHLTTSIATLQRLIYLLDTLQTGEIGLDEISGDDIDIFNYFMDLEGL